MIFSSTRAGVRQSMRLQLEEPAVEPGTEQVHEVTVHQPELRVSGQGVEQGFAHREDLAGAVRGGVHQAQELLAPRLGCGRERRRRVCGSGAAR